MSVHSYFCGIDLAKNHFSLHAVDQNGKVLKNGSYPKFDATRWRYVG